MVCSTKDLAAALNGYVPVVEQGSGSEKVFRMEKSNIRLIKMDNPTSDGAEDLKEMYKEYIAEMKPFADMPSLEWHLGVKLRLIKDGDIPVGFISHATYPQALSRHDVYIKDIYVRPEYRGKCIARIAVAEIVWGKYPDKDVTIEIADGNERAADFWHKALTGLGYEERTSNRSIHAKLSNGARIFYWIRGNVGKQG